MQQFVVPQFIDVEDKIIGPVTTRQFIIMLVGFIIIGISYKLFDFSLFVTVASTMLTLSIMFAFIRINGRPFHFFVLNLLQTLKRPRLRVWHYHLIQAEIDYGSEPSRSAASAKLPLEKHYAISRLAELSLIVDTKGAYGGEKNESGITKIETDEIKRDNF